MKPDRKLLFEKEQFYIDTLRPEFNIEIVVGKPSSGLSLSEDHRRKISEANKGKIKSDEVRKAISIAHKGKILTEDHKRKIGEAGVGRKGIPRFGESNPFYGKKHSDVLKEKLREVHTGLHPSEETRNKMSKSQKGRKHSEETKAKMKESRARQAPMSEETKAKISKTLTGRKMTEDQRKKLVEGRSKIPHTIPICPHPHKRHKGNGLCTQCFSNFKYKRKKMPDYTVERFLKEMQMKILDALSIDDVQCKSREVIKRDEIDD